MSQCMLLDGKENDLLGELEVGQAIVKLQGRIPKAFMIELPEFHIEKGAITDNAVALRMQPVLEARMAVDQQEEGGGKSESKEKLQAGSEDAEPDLEQLFLQDVREYPDSGIAERYRRLGISVRQGQKLKLKLVEKGLIEEAKKKTKTGRLRVIRLAGEDGQELS